LIRKKTGSKRKKITGLNRKKIAEEVMKDPLQSKKRGRKANIMTLLKTQLQRDCKLELSANQILDVAQLLLEANTDEVKNIVADKESPLFVKIIGERLVNDRFAAEMLDRIITRLLAREGLRETTDNVIELRFSDNPTIQLPETEYTIENKIEE
jgi:hypothetical protein